MIFTTYYLKLSKIYTGGDYATKPQRILYCPIKLVAQSHFKLSEIKI